MNRIDELFTRKQQNVLSVYFTAGYPNLSDSRVVLESLQTSGADLVEIGIPYSDPVADGPTIQESNQQAISNGMTIKKLFEQLEKVREEVEMPIILMGYLNPIMQFGVEAFCQKCQEAGVDGLIIPDLPMYEFTTHYKELFEKHHLHNIFLITPQTSTKRIKEIDQNTSGFIYMVSSASITGAKGEITKEQTKYFDRVNDMGLKNPRLIGFGISDNKTFHQACQYASGAIIGSAFINLLKASKNLPEDIDSFIRSVRS